LDEPTNGLDPNQIVEIRNVIKEIGKEKTVILSTHYARSRSTLLACNSYSQRKYCARHRYCQFQGKFQNLEEAFSNYTL
jgi:ABC-2 type transport system ATP-binding protein